VGLRQAGVVLWRLSPTTQGDSRSPFLPPQLCSECCLPPSLAQGSLNALTSGSLNFAGGNNDLRRYPNPLHEKIDHATASVCIINVRNSSLESCFCHGCAQMNCAQSSRDRYFIMNIQTARLIGGVASIMLSAALFGLACYIEGRFIFY
jgi:hypothetical protein